jgi:LuxR family transcriptional regulator, regulator of acetate metabolism
VNVRAERAAPLVGIGQALRRLRPAVSLGALLRLTATVICESVGFERAALFSLQGHTLVVSSVHMTGAPERAERLLMELRSKPVALGPGLYESEVLRCRRPLIMRDASADLRALGALPGSDSYVAVPLVCHERVVGLVHADRGLSGLQVTELDRDALAAFAEGVGYALERDVLAERLRAQSERVVALARSTEASVTQPSGSDFELSRRSPPPPPDALGDELTRRELEVLTMLAEGATNVGIAQRLVVSEGTVKTHVKHIFRKLGVQNRSHAVCRYYRALERSASEPANAPRGAERSLVRSMCGPE